MSANGQVSAALLRENCKMRQLICKRLGIPVPFPAYSHISSYNSSEVEPVHEHACTCTRVG